MAAIGDQSESFDELAAAIDALPDPQRAFELATELAKALDDLKGPAASLRARQARRIFEAEKMTLTELGNRIGGLTKQRAGKMLQEAIERSDRQKEGEVNG